MFLVLFDQTPLIMIVERKVSPVLSLWSCVGNAIFFLFITLCIRNHFDYVQRSSEQQTSKVYKAKRMCTRIKEFAKLNKISLTNKSKIF